MNFEKLKFKNFKKTDIELDFDKHIEEFYFIDSISRSSNPGGDLAEGERVIMQVLEHNIFNANYDDKNRKVKIDAQTTIKLIGKKTSSSPKVKQAYISFVKTRSGIRPPKYSKSRETLYFWMDYNNLEAVLKAIHEPLAYCWVGRFGEGGNNVYGDIHTDPLHQ